MDDFAAQLSRLVAKEMRSANGDPVRTSEVLERLLHSAGFTITLMAGADKKLLSELTTASEAQLYEAVSSHSKFTELFGLARRP